MTDDKPASAHVYLTIPADQPRILSFVRFIEHVGDNSPVFRTTSGVARFGLLLAALATAEGGVAKLDRASYELLKRAIEAEGESAVTLDFGQWFEGADGERHFVSAGIPTRAWAPYINAILNAAETGPTPAAILDLVENDAQAAE